MTPPKRRYSMEELVRCGTEMYERVVLPQVEAGNHGRIVAVDIETGDFEFEGAGLTGAGQNK